MIVARPLSAKEPDLLLGREYDVLNIKDLDGIPCISYSPPHQGWTHDALEGVDYYSVSPFGWDAYLGNEWIGSSEV